MASVGEIIQELRIEAGMKQNDLAKILNVAPSTISSYEQGINKPDYETLTKLSDLFQVNLDYLVGNTRIRAHLSTFNDGVKLKDSVIPQIDFIREVNQLDEEDRNFYVKMLKILKNQTKYNKD